MNQLNDSAQHYDREKIEKLFSEFLDSIGEDSERDGLLETPKRVAKMYAEVLEGYQINIDTLYKLFDYTEYNGLVSVSNIEFFSLCEHHLLPFFGTASIAYIRKNKILGLSKFARIVKAYSRRLQTQENITKQIADSIEEHLETNGCIVMLKARHLCMEMRGIESKNGFTTTLVKKGLFKNNLILENEFYNSIKV